MICNNPETCTCTSFNSKFCKWYGSAKREKKRPANRKGLKQVSDKMKEDLKIYAVLRKSYLKSNPFCQAKCKGCTGVSHDVHHRARRGPNLLIVEKWMAVCRNCHQYIETHPTESREKLWIL